MAHICAELSLGDRLALFQEAAKSMVIKSGEAVVSVDSVDNAEAGTEAATANKVKVGKYMVLKV